jgi:hypothetical protein
MALLDRIFRDGDTAFFRANHFMAAGMYVVARGEFTLQQFKNAMNLEASDDAQLNELVAHYQALSATEQERFFPDWTAWTILAEHGAVTRAMFATRFDLTE